MKDPSEKLRSFLEELKRRRVFRVVFYYGAVAFAVVQGVDIAFQALDVPSWAFRAVVVAGLLGFPVALLLSWVYDLTPEGVIRTPPAGGATGPGGAEPRASVRWVARGAFAFVSLVLVAGVIWLSVRWAAAGATGPAGDRKSIAVLPFQAIPDTGDAVYFAEGVHEDLLGQLAKVGELRVISRTSVQQYRNTDKNVRQIASELGVGTVLEGTVRRSGGRIRVTAQLIDARTDDHLWAETFDRKEEDVFQIQSAIAQEIARALEAELSQEERQRMADLPRANVPAYDAYNRGRLHFSRRESQEQALEAVAQFRRATELDADFAPAWASLARAEMWLFWKWPGYAQRADSAVAALGRAAELAPDAPETHLAQGYLHFYGRGDYAEALEEFRAAALIRPGDPEPVAAEALIRRRQGRWEEAVVGLRDAFAQDPHQYSLAFALGETLLRMRRFGAAEEALNRAMDIARDLPEAYRRKIWARLGATGDVGAATRLLDSLRTALPPGALSDLEADLALYRGDARTALDLRLEHTPDAHLEIALAAHFAGRDSLRDLHASRVVARVDSLLERFGDGPGAVQAGVLAEARSAAGVAQALLGRRAAAIREGSFATALVPVTTDAFWGAEQLVRLATIYALVGEHEAAVDRVQTALSMPSPLTPADLRMSPVFATLRDHPRYPGLVAADAEDGP